MTHTKKRYYFFYTSEFISEAAKQHKETSFILSEKDCIYPERTKEFKILKDWGARDIIQTYGYSTTKNNIDNLKN
jgi:hypothetical protein